MKKLFFLFAAWALPFSLQAQSDQDARLAEAQRIVDTFHFQQGEVSLGDGFAKVSIPPDFTFLGPDDTETFLTKLWGNPPHAQKPLGLLMPADMSPLSSHIWVVVITYMNDGYVKDAEADSIDYNKMLKEMQKTVHAANEERVKKGYPAVEMVGWAEAPHYDKEAHKLYWAKEMKFGNESKNTLNYNIRILGRHGVLVLNIVAGMDQLPDVEKAAPAILNMVDFTPGNAYADYKSGTDKVATYGLAALVAGGIAAKLGLFKGLLIALAALKKFIILGAVAVIAWIRRFFGWKKKDAPSA